MRNQLLKEWNPKNEGAPADYTDYSNKKVWWVCEMGHEWQECVSNRTKGSGCPYCSGRRACYHNCLKTLFPNLCEQWSEKNKVDPRDVASGTHKKYWWVCPKGHKWEASVVKRTKEKRGCPFCANQKVSNDNCLSSVCPQIAAEWHPAKNKPLTPNDVVFGSCTKVWWLCNCGISWLATPSKRTRQNTGCPVCKASRGERVIAEWLKHETIHFYPQYKFKKCRNKFELPFDFYIPEYKSCIEFQGEHHYKPISHFGGKDKYRKTIARDAIKKTFCEENGLRLLTVPFWKIASIRILLKEFFYG